MHKSVSKGVFGVFILTTMLAAGPTTKPATKPTTDGAELTQRQKNLLTQLSDTEANIQAVNKALVLTGYKVGLEYNRIDSNRKGNDIMNRKGGGPVRWDEFYGKTSKDYGNSDWGDRRPAQFAFIYKANYDQIGRAREQIATMAKDQTSLLARRQKHEADQSRLWALLAWEQIKDREIAFKPLYRFALQPKGPEAAVLRPVILFLRTADQVAIEGLESVQADPAATFEASSQRMATAYKALQQSLADALDSADLQPQWQKEGQTLKALCKELAEGSTVIAENYHNALDRDQAKQDSSKLIFRAQLQSSLATFSSVVCRLDEQVRATAASWLLAADRNTLNPDFAVPQVSFVKSIPTPRNRAPQGVEFEVPSVNTKFTGTNAGVKIKATVLESTATSLKIETRNEAGAIWQWDFDVNRGKLVLKNDGFLRLHVGSNVKHPQPAKGIEAKGTLTPDGLRFEFVWPQTPENYTSVIELTRVRK